MAFCSGILLGAILVYVLKGAKKPEKLPVFDEIETKNLAIDNFGAIAIIWPEDDDILTPLTKPQIFGNAQLQKEIIKFLAIENDDILAGIEKLSPELCEKIIDLRQKGIGFDAMINGLEFNGKINNANAVLTIRIAPINYGARGMMHFSFPIWKSDANGQLIWGNDAFVKAVEKINLANAIKTNARLDKKEAQDSMDAIKGSEIIDTRAISIGGQRRMMRIMIAPSFDGAIGMAIDIDDEFKAHELLSRESQAHTETLNQLNDAVAVFDAGRNLITYNSAFAKLWNFDDVWLDEKPRHEEILDSLRQKSRIPHQKNYSEWRASQMAYYQSNDVIADETWTLPDGRIFRLMRQRQPTGGLLILFEDISDKASLQAQYKTQIEVQRTTLDRLREGIAVFAGDGKITLANRAFLQLWDIDKAIIDENPDFAPLVHHLKTSYNDEEFWDELWARVCDPSPEGRQETQGTIERRDESILTWLTRPLPDGATLVAFADVTAHHRNESLLREKNLALAEADRLKTAFLEKVSYQLRTPLTTISGYAEILHGGYAGEINNNQNDYLGAIRNACEQLETMVGDLLDLAIIDAGQAPLDLGDVNIKDVLEKTHQIIMTKVTDSQVDINVECPQDTGLMRGDDKRIRQIMFNLLSNAMNNAQACDNITMGAHRLNDSIKLYVTQPSHNTDDTMLNFEFDAFTEGSRRGGLSLVLVKKFVELHGGWLAIDFTNRELITIICHLPINAVPSQQAPELAL